jgi:hypothetical protein
MRRLVTLLLLVFFASTQTSPSMSMLSIEKGRVYTEGYNLCHIIKAAYSSTATNSQDKYPCFGCSSFLSHRHVQLSRYIIPENPTASTIAPVFPIIDFFPVYQAVSSSLAASPSPKHLGLSKRLKLSITPLLQSSVLLI